MIYTSEIRWFSQDHNRFSHIFQGLKGESSREKPRTDTYLRARNKNLGIKLRNGLLDIKIKASKTSITNMGYTENWVKWSHTIDKELVTQLMQGQDTLWVAVGKERIKKNYIVDTQNNSVYPTQMEAKSNCAVEFTHLKFNSENSWCTIGLEASGTMEKTNKYLFHTINFLNLRDINFPNAQCVSYPEFITKLFQDSRL